MGRICVWVMDESYYEGGIYDTSCDNRHEFIVGDVAANSYKFCPYCGARIKEVEKESLYEVS